MFELLQPLMAGPVLPATILLGILMTWSVLTITVGVGLDLQTPLHGHFESVSHAFWDAIGSVAMVPLKWLNLRNIPFMLWIGIFAIVWWFISIGLWMTIDDRFLSEPTATPHWIVTLVLILRNLAIALPLTKFATQPLRGWFQTSSFESKSLIGKEAEISSYDATPDNGQVKFKTDGAPLLLNVRTDGPHLAKGTRVWITHYDSVKRRYIVSPTTTEASFSSPE
jgi:hypothetical protein